MKTVKKIILSNLADLALCFSVWFFPLAGFVFWIFLGVNIISILSLVGASVHIAFAGVRLYFLLDAISKHFERSYDE